MRLATIQKGGTTTVVGVKKDDDGDYFVELAASAKCVGALLEADPDLATIRDSFATSETRVPGTLLAPIPRPGKVICIGLNYRDHAAESGAEIPGEPVVFGKFTSAVIGPEDPIRLSRELKQVDFEAELVVVIGKPGRDIREGDAMQHVAGYMCGHDVSARDWQKGRPGGQWLLGKTPDTFAPLGPWLVSADEVADPHDLRIQLRLNGETMQDSRTTELIFSVPELIAHISRVMTLLPGDVIFTGTPPGVGAARKPPVFLKPGDVVEVDIEGLGVLRNSVRDLAD